MSDLIQITYRPIDQWPRQETRLRQSSPFRANWQSTKDLLKSEIRALRGRHLIIGLSVKESEIRNDGQLRQRTRPSDPRVMIGFDTRQYGWLYYFDDLYDRWHGNARAIARAIALTLRDLRLAGQRGAIQGEQYVGSKKAIEGHSPGATRQGALSEASPYRQPRRGTSSSAPSWGRPVCLRLRLWP